MKRLDLTRKPMVHAAEHERAREHGLRGGESVVLGLDITEMNLAFVPTARLGHGQIGTIKQLNASAARRQLPAAAC